ncbi:hypothetical protein [Rhodopseudomonas sp. BR0G17]|uniref:hypothetical protein n=1 Tax=Rhodopseudomonas sp. BR0G17 TaxID=2269368 RepID=UPI0013DF967B|nr:hypothetical protein [Rhodopseudomonas sp. BR0G17]NEW96630.1 hypothetical protein [Rhodopseudomonas sp. BR0G17]
MALARLEVDATQVAELAQLFETAGRKAPAAIGRAIRRTGDMAKTRVVRALVAQTGLKRKVIVKAVKAKPGAMTYTLKTRGGNVSLKYFGARETRRGVSAAPWNRRRVFGGAFIKGGRFPNRVALGLNGQVFARVGKSRLPIARQRSGLYIPTEMIKGETRGAFLGTVNAVLPAKLRHEIAAILGGHVAG